jgi:hypothetical protein
MIFATREQRRAAARESAKLPEKLVEIPKAEWANATNDDPTRFRVWRSRHFLVQAFMENYPDPLVRLSINRTTLGANGRWLEDISWDDLQRVKREAGYADLDAVELFPADKDVVNVANMRHLWVFLEPGRLPFAWRAKA